MNGKNTFGCVVNFCKVTLTPHYTVDYNPITAWVFSFLKYCTWNMRREKTYSRWHTSCILELLRTLVYISQPHLQNPWQQNRTNDWSYITLKPSSLPLLYPWHWYKACAWMWSLAFCKEPFAMDFKPFGGQSLYRMTVTRIKSLWKMNECTAFGLFLQYVLSAVLKNYYLLHNMRWLQ